jgi:hypothetical protein
MLGSRINLEMSASDDGLLDGSMVRVLSTIGENLIQIPEKIPPDEKIQSTAVKECLKLVGEALCPPPTGIKKVQQGIKKVQRGVNQVHAGPPKSHQPEPSNYDAVEPYSTRQRTPSARKVSKAQAELPSVVIPFEQRLDNMNHFIDEAKDIVRTNNSYAGNIAKFEFSVLCKILSRFSTDLCNVHLKDSKAGAKLMQILMQTKFTADAASEKKIGPFYKVFNAISQSMQGMGRSLEVANTPETLSIITERVLETLASNMLSVCESPMQALNPECEESMFAAIYSLNPQAA